MTTIDLIPSEKASINLLATPPASAVLPMWSGAGGAFQNTGDASLPGSLFVPTVKSIQVGPGNQLIRNPANASGHLSLESQDGHSFLTAKLNAHLASNAYWDGTNWMRYDTSQAGGYFFMSGGSGLTLSTASAGANPLSATNKFTVDGSGNATLVGYLNCASGTVSSNWTVNGTITTAAINSSDWFRCVTSVNGIYSNVQGAGVYFPSASTVAHYPSGARFLDTRDYSVAVAGSGSKLVMRDGNGYIFTNYINTTADIAGGSPAYVAGQNGDNYLRWYPKAL